jgi:hypothetical protein
LWIQNCTFYSRTCQKFNVKSSRKKKITEIYEFTQYHWNKKCYTFTDTDCDLGWPLHCNNFTFLQFQTWGWWPPPSADRKANGTWSFQGSGATAPEYYKLSNFTYGSSSSYYIDDASQILLLYTCRQPQLPHSPTSTSWSSWGW